MRILGVDGAMSGPAGFCIVDTEAPMLFLAAGVITFDGKQAPLTRYARLYAAVELWASRWQVEAIAAEDAYHDRNVTTTIALARAGIVAFCVALAQGLPFTFVSTLDTGRVLATLPARLLDRAVAPIPKAQQEHARCAAAIGWHGHGLLTGVVTSGPSLRQRKRPARKPAAPVAASAPRKARSPRKPKGR